jgi:hypothetical protein
MTAVTVSGSDQTRMGIEASTRAYLTENVKQLQEIRLNEDLLLKI